MTCYNCSWCQSAAWCGGRHEVKKHRQWLRCYMEKLKIKPFFVKILKKMPVITQCCHRFYHPKNCSETFSKVPSNMSTSSPTYFSLTVTIRSRLRYSWYTFLLYEFLSVHYFHMFDGVYSFFWVTSDKGKLHWSFWWIFIQRLASTEKETGCRMFFRLISHLSWRHSHVLTGWLSECTPEHTANNRSILCLAMYSDTKTSYLYLSTSFKAWI